jgi:hypothetical protein
MDEAKRGPGRPKQEPKKGNPSWKPASLNDFVDKEPGYRYRMSRKDPANLAKKEQEGWVNVSGIEGSETKHIQAGRIDDGKALTSVQEGHDWVLQKIPEELAQERDAYYNKESERRVSGLTSHIKKELGNEGADTHGDITISTRKGLN